MTCPEDRERAAATIDPRSLEKAKRAITVGCGESLKRLDRLEEGLKNVRTDRDASRFSRALSMYLLAFLPLRPETCPFCVQHSGGNRCQGCGYAETHGGRCDAETSAFGQLIESVYDLAGEVHKIRDDPPVAKFDPDGSRMRLKGSIRRSRVATEILMAMIPESSISELMVAKRDYIENILDALPRDLMASVEVETSLEDVREKLLRYW